jgi:UDP-N-acetylglucosamine--dolichyl-phosphate N-acetylglucosaminephosphotransferase
MMVELFFLAAIAVTSFCLTFFSLPIIVRKMRIARIVGHDVNKPGKPEVAEMGGLAIVVGVIGALLLAIALRTFAGYQFNLNEIMAAMLTMTIISLVGIFDDLFDMRKDVKTLLPMVAALPLVALATAGSTTISLPFLGQFDFGIFYIVVLIPLGVTVSANLTNMLAGFNGMEAGMGSVIFASVLLLAVANGASETGMIAAAMLGALLSFLRLNWYPAKVFIGDIGTLLIGGTLAVCVIIGNVESAGAILVAPYLFDFVIKAYNRFPSTNWWGEARGKDGRLHPLGGKVRGLAQLAMKLSGGITEKRLVLLFIAAEGLFALLAILLYGRNLFA